MAGLPPSPLVFSCLPPEGRGRGTTDKDRGTPDVGLMAECGGQRPKQGDSLQGQGNEAGQSWLGSPPPPRVMFSHSQDRATSEGVPAPRLDTAPHPPTPQAFCSGTGAGPQDSNPNPLFIPPPPTIPRRTVTQNRRGAGSWSPLPLGAGSGESSALACGNREGLAGCQPG